MIIRFLIICIKMMSNLVVINKLNNLNNLNVINMNSRKGNQGIICIGNKGERYEWYNFLCEQKKKAIKITVCEEEYNNLKENIIKAYILDGIVDEKSYICFITSENIKKEKYLFFKKIIVFENSKELQSKLCSILSLFKRNKLNLTKNIIMTKSSQYKNKCCYVEFGSDLFIST